MTRMDVMSSDDPAIIAGMFGGSVRACRCGCECYTLAEDIE
jgi:hypothetical protein